MSKEVTKINTWPDPPIPSDVDLRSYDWMPLKGVKLFNSDFDYLCNDTEWRAGVTLWWAAWQQVPAGSLPDNDRALCSMAGFGRDVAAFQNVKENALRGFVKCSDGRLYHTILCAEAMTAWGKKREAKKRKEEFLNKKSSQQERAENETRTRSERVPEQTENAQERVRCDLERVQNAFQNANEVVPDCVPNAFDDRSVVTVTVTVHKEDDVVVGTQEEGLEIPEENGGVQWAA